MMNKRSFLCSGAESAPISFGCKALQSDELFFQYCNYCYLHNKRTANKNIKTNISVPGNCEIGASSTSSLVCAHKMKSEERRLYKEFLY